MIFRFLFLFYFVLYIAKSILPNPTIFYAISLFVGVLFFKFGFKYKWLLCLIITANLSYFLVVVGSHDRYLVSYISIYLLMMSNLFVYSYLFYIVNKGRSSLLFDLRRDFLKFGLIVFSLLFIMELMAGGIVRVDHLSFFGHLINRNSIHPLVLSILFTYLLLKYLCDSLFIIVYKSHDFVIYLSGLVLFLSNSRSAQVIAVFICIYHFLSVRRIDKKLILILCIICSMFYVLYFVDLSFIFSRFVEKGENSGLESSRFFVLECYRNNFEFSQLILGFHEGGNDLCAYAPRVIEKNPHNSIIWSASVYGFITFIGIFIFCKNWIKYFFERNIELCILYGCFFIALNSERAYLVTPLDIPFLIFIMLPFLIKKLKFEYEKNINIFT